MIDKKEKINLISKDEALFSGIKNGSLFREEHSEYVTLPDTFHLLAKSSSCNNEAMKHKSKKIYTTQFHPEMSGGDGTKIFENFLKMCSEQ